MAELTRFELATFRVTGGRSNQLSYNSKCAAEYMGNVFSRKSFVNFSNRSMKLKILDRRFSLIGGRIHYTPRHGQCSRTIDYEIITRPHVLSPLIYSLATRIITGFRKVYPSFSNDSGKARGSCECSSCYVIREI